VQAALKAVRVNMLFESGGLKNVFGLMFHEVVDTK
jgi:hypothetical protein